jgi:hypothetical protein
MLPGRQSASPLLVEASGWAPYGMLRLSPAANSRRCQLPLALAAVDRCPCSTPAQLTDKDNDLTTMEVQSTLG